MSIRKGIRKLIIERCAACETSGGVCDLETDVVDPVMDIIDDIALSSGYEYIDEENHWEDDGRMFDYGHSKSDSHEGKMTKGKLFRMGQQAQSLHDRLEDNDDLPEWVNSHVTTAADRLSSVYDYMAYQLHRMKTDGKMCNETIIRSMARNYLRSVIS